MTTTQIFLEAELVIGRQEVVSKSIKYSMLCISAAYAVMWCLSVCLSVTFVSSVIMNKHIVKIFPPSDGHTTLVFLYQTSWQYSDGDSPNGGIECKGGMTK